MKTFILASVALLATPVFAQSAPPAPAAPAAQTQAAPQKPERVRPVHVQGKHMRGPMFKNMSPEGRKILMEAMRGASEDRGAIQASRDRVNAAIGADRLDVTALKRAMDDERRLVDAQQVKRQQAMLTAVQKLSVEDRKAFAADAMKARANVEKRTAEWRKRAEERRNSAKPVTPGGSV